MLVENIHNTQSFGTYKKFKKMFKVCAYSGEPFKANDTKTIEHIIPKSRGGKRKLKNFIVIKRSTNHERSSIPLAEYIRKNPQVQENILNTLSDLKGKIIDGINWAEEARKTLYQETHIESFR